MNDYELKVVAAMRQHGGAFVGALATAMGLADLANFLKLKDSFPHIWREYSEIVARQERIERARAAGQ